MKTDRELQTDVMDELQRQDILNAAEIGVAVKDGVVILSGTVDSYAKKLAAEHAAKKVEGVSVIVEDIEMVFPGSLKHNDSEIAHAILETLKWHTAVKEDRVKVKVEHGWVTVEGEVNQQYQKDEVKYVIEFIRGVKGVNNLVKVRPGLSLGRRSRVHIDTPSLVRSMNSEVMIAN